MVEKAINADEKTEIEVVAMKLIRLRPTILITKVKSGKLAADSDLGVGPNLRLRGPRRPWEFWT